MTTDGMGGTDGTIKVVDIISREEEATTSLRFVERHVDLAGTIRPVRILQQQWQIVERRNGDGLVMLFDLEWRDVPLEAEG